MKSLKSEKLKEFLVSCNFCVEELEKFVGEILKFLKTLSKNVQACFHPHRILC